MGRLTPNNPIFHHRKGKIFEDVHFGAGMGANVTKYYVIYSYFQQHLENTHLKKSIG